MLKIMPSVQEIYSLDFGMLQKGGYIVTYIKLFIFSFQKYFSFWKQVHRERYFKVNKFVTNNLLSHCFIFSSFFLLIMNIAYHHHSKNSSFVKEKNRCGVTKDSKLNWMIQKHASFFSLGYAAVAVVSTLSCCVNVVLTIHKWRKGKRIKTSHSWNS